MAEQLMATNGPCTREEALWIACANSSLPVPLSPTSMTEEADSAALCATSSTRRISALEPTMSSQLYLPVPALFTWSSSRSFWRAAAELLKPKPKAGLIGMRTAMAPGTDQDGPILGRLERITSPQGSEMVPDPMRGLSCSG